MSRQLLKRALRKFKSQANLARELKVSRQFINQLTRDKSDRFYRPMPKEMVDMLEALLNS